MNTITNQIKLTYIREFPTIQKVYQFTEQNKLNIIKVYHLNLGGLFNNDIANKELIYSCEKNWLININDNKDLIKLFNYRGFSKELYSNPNNIKLWNLDPNEIDKITFDFISHTYIFETLIPFESLIL